MIILGAGRGTAELLALIRHARGCGHGPQWRVVGILDDDPSLAGTSLDGVTVLGGIREAGRFPDALFLSGIANIRDPRSRLNVAERAGLPDARWATFVHPRAIVADNACVGPGTIVYPNCAVSAHARVGSHCVLYYGTVVHHDAVVGDGCCLCAAVSLAGHAIVGRGCYLGMGSLIRGRVAIGDGAVVGMGAAVVKDVAPGQVVAGVPAKPLRSEQSAHKAQP